MKAAEDIVMAFHKIDKVIVPYKDGSSTKDLEFITIKKGKDIPDKYLERFVRTNIELIAGVVFKDKVPINLPKGIWKPELTGKVMKIKRRKYSQTSLTEIYNDKGFSELKKIGSEFGVTDRSYRRLITEILAVQEERQRNGI